MFLFHSVELLPESGCLATASHGHVTKLWQTACGHHFQTGLKKPSCTTFQRPLSSILMKGRQRIQRGENLKVRGDHWAHEDCFSQHLTTLKQKKETYVYVVSCWRVSGFVLLQQGIPSTATPAHLYHRAEDCHCSCVSPLWSVLLGPRGQESHPHFTGASSGFALNGV